MTRFAFVDREKALYAVAGLCRLKVSTAHHPAALNPFAAASPTDALVNETDSRYLSER